MQTIYTDVLVIGAGLAGERAAIEAGQAGLSTICLSLVPARRSHSAAAQGGMQAALGNNAMGEGDSPDVHFEDTVKGSDWGCDQEVARLFADTAPIEMRRLAHWGTPWNRVVPGTSKYFKGGKEFEKTEKEENRGLITARAFGGTAKWRTCYVSDGTGHSVLFTVDNRCAELGVEVHDKVEAIALVHDGETCFGAITRCMKTGDLRTYLSKATMIASGGFGRIYPNSTNAVVCDGGGHIPAIDTGVVPMGNMEAVQFHPTGICPTDILVTEGCRGDGGTLLDVNEERFMDKYEPEKAELASRDVVSRWMTHHIREGKGVKSAYGDHLWLDIRHLGEKHITGKLREVHEICTSFLGVDPIHQLIPVKPTQHYSMGGVRTNRDGAAYGLKGLFSAGEAACWDMHGFNRLGGNSLAETVVAGGIVGRKMAEYVLGAEVIFNSAIIDGTGKAQAERIKNIVAGKNGSENVFKVRADMQAALDKGANIFRTKEGLEECVESLQKTLERSRKVGLKSGVGVGAAPELMAALRIEGQVKMALMIAYGALMRTESRGSHNREDFTARNDRDWLKRTLAYWKNPTDMLPTLEYEPFSALLDIPPGYRGYGKMDIIPMEGMEQEKTDAVAPEVTDATDVGEKGDK